VIEHVCLRQGARCMHLVTDLWLEDVGMICTITMTHAAIHRQMVNRTRCMQSVYGRVHARQGARCIHLVTDLWLKNVGVICNH
jgi:hypothetical protein